jgi:LuxR family maltose regulon positive regulatory protein
MRAALCADGTAQMEVDAEAAIGRLAADDPWRPAALLVRGAAAMLLEDLERADAVLSEAVERAATAGSIETRSIALGERSLLAAARDDVRASDALAEEAQLVVEEGGLAGYPTSALALAASARSRIRHGQWDHARRLLTAATRVTPHLTYALPWLAVQARIELDEARGIHAVRPELGVLGELVTRLDLEVAAMPDARNGGSSGLTRAELRLLPLLSTHLSFREIGERLHVSRNTIKTQAISVYRKLGVSSRSEAVAVAEDLGLVEAADSKVELEVGEVVGAF